MSASILERCNLLTRWASEHFDQTGTKLRICMRRGVLRTETRVELENDHRSSLDRTDERLRDHSLNLDSVRAIRRKFRVERFSTYSII